MKLRLLFLFLGCTLISCAKQESTIQEQDMPPLLVNTNLRRHLGARIAVEGIAANAKEGALVKVLESVVFVADLDTWPQDLIGKRVRVTGKLAERKEMPDPDPEDRWLQGAFGSKLILDEAKWSLVDN